MFLKEQIFLRILGFITNNLRYRERETSKTNTMEDASTDEEGRSTKKTKADFAGKFRLGNRWHYPDVTIV